MVAIFINKGGGFQSEMLESFLRHLKWILFKVQMDTTNFKIKGWPKTYPANCLHEVVAVEHFIDVGNILGKSWVSHLSFIFTQIIPGLNLFDNPYFQK